MIDPLTVANVAIALVATIFEVIYCVALFTNNVYVSSNVRRQFQLNIPPSIFLSLGSLIRDSSHLRFYNLSTFLIQCTFYFNVFGLCMMLLGTAAIIIERLIATVLWRRYSSFSVAIRTILWLTAVCLSVAAAITYNEGKIISRVIVLWILHLFFSGLTALLILRNRALRRVSRSMAQLNYSYQLVENLRVLTIVMPHLCVITVLASTAPLSLIICPLVGVSLRNSVEVFFLIYNTVLLLCLTIAIRRNYLQRWKRRPKVSMVRAVLEIKGPLGTKMPAKDTIDDHFRALQSSWEGMTGGKRKV